MSIVRGSNTIDLRKTTSTGGGTGELPQYLINIIESNTGTQVDVPIYYTEIDWLSGVPSTIRKYTDSGKGTIVYTITIEWSSGIPTTITSINHDDGITSITTIYWSNGMPIQITKE